MSNVTIAVADQLNSLPSRSRRGGGRNHVPYWCMTGPTIAEDDFGALTFSARSTTPERVVTFGRKRLTFSFISAKTCTAQAGESAWEYLLAKHLEADPDVIDYDMHSFQLAWNDGDDIVHSYRPDALWSDIAGQVTCGEVKASEGYFTAPQALALYSAAQAGLSNIGIRFARVTGDRLQEDRRRAFNVSRAFADRLTAFSPRQLDDAQNAVASGEVPLGKLAEILDVDRRAVLQVANAMMVKRHVAYDLSAPVTKDTMIRAPKPATAKPDIRSIGL